MCAKLRVPCRFVTEHPCCKLPQDIGMLGRWVNTWLSLLHVSDHPHYSLQTSGHGWQRWPQVEAVSEQAGNLGDGARPEPSWILWRLQLQHPLQQLELCHGHPGAKVRICTSTHLNCRQTVWEKEVKGVQWQFILVYPKLKNRNSLIKGALKLMSYVWEKEVKHQRG